MNWFTWLLLAAIALDTFVRILCIGETHPITTKNTALNTAFNAFVVWGILHYFAHIL